MGDGQDGRHEHGYHLFPERDPRNPKQEPFLSRLYGLKIRCKARLKIAMDTKLWISVFGFSAVRHDFRAAEYNTLGAATETHRWTEEDTAYRERHFSCEECDGKVGGGFDSSTSEIVICQNNINDQRTMNRMLTHELIHAYDHCRAQVDFLSNIRHLACTEIRAASLSGDCSLGNEMSRFKFGVKQHHQTCVRDRAVRSIVAARKFSQETAEKAVDEVFDSCFNDREPFGRIPHNTAEANMAYKEFRNRGRYYANI
ncbi:mitochondrial inner membrane protease ATP23 homolog isoform X1 [Phyllobates terribilis]|uniref:mitochondrial inner membrane protease ATP23 homolog isoform X1 n=1 Tax=Phyllobates terribilis TaxID=111132 RepID=UPI003CCA81B9